MKNFTLFLIERRWKWREKKEKKASRSGRSGVRWQRKFFCGWLTTRINQLQKFRDTAGESEETENLKERRWGLSWKSIIQLCSDIYIKNQSIEDFCYRPPVSVDARQSPILIKKQSFAPFFLSLQWLLIGRSTMKHNSKWGQRENLFYLFVNASNEIAARIPSFHSNGNMNGCESTLSSVRRDFQSIFKLARESRLESNFVAGGVQVNTRWMQPVILINVSGKRVGCFKDAKANLSCVCLCFGRVAGVCSALCNLQSNGIDTEYDRQMYERQKQLCKQMPEVWDDGRKIVLN